MTSFQNYKFLFLPSLDYSNLKFLSGLLTKKGGKIIESVQRLDPETTVVVNDSFINEEQSIIHEDILKKESDVDIDYLYDYIIDNSLKCVRASTVSRWLKTGHLATPETDLIHVPSDTDEEGSLNGRDFNSDSELDTDVEEASHGSQDNGKHEEKNTARKDFSGGISKFSGQKWSKNELVIKFLDILSNRYKVKGDSFRSRGYNLAKIGIQRLSHEIQSGEETRKEVSNIGASIAKKIQTILDTGTLPGAYESPQSEKDLRYLSECYNVGTYTARRWTNLGLRTFVEVARKFPQELRVEWPIIFGWSFYEDWSVPIPREECSQIGKIVRRELKLVDPDCQVEIQGSYLRGADYCGDLDFLFYKENCNDTSYMSSIMEEVAVRLYRNGYIECFLQLTPRIRELFGPKIVDRLKKCNLPIQTQDVIPTNQNIKKFHLGFRIPGLIDEKNESHKSLLAPSDQFMSLSRHGEHCCRRVDFFSCKWSELGASRLQWTGPKEFNRWLRMTAIEKGMKLTQHGLFDSNDRLLESFSDRKILQLLDQPYLEPEERNQVLKKRRSK